LDCSKKITLRDLWLAGLVGRSVKQGIKLLGNGSVAFTAKVDIEVSDASLSAISRVEECGGSIVTRHFSRVALRAHLKPEKFAVMPKAPAPSSKHMKHYLNDAKRGYLSRHVQLKQHAARSATAEVTSA
jgi:large subunit ribosomal protein L15